MPLELEILARCTISVVIPVFNRQRLGERAIFSACAQAFDGMEIIIVDDGSDPPFCVPAAALKFANVRLVRHKVNRGASVARNSGIAAAQGEWVALLDSDDYWLPATLERRLDFANKIRVSPRSDLVVCAAGFVLKKGDREGDLRIPREAISLGEFACGCWFAPGSTMLFRKELFERIGPFDAELPRLEDYDWFIRFALAGGRLRVWNAVAAIVDVQGKPSREAVEAGARHLIWKYALKDSPQKLPAPIVRRLKAMLDVERASLCLSRHQWISTIYYLARSFVLAPRIITRRRRFWAAGR
jgi:glycosyltransferase involved in cell wall biosynthesis